MSIEKRRNSMKPIVVALDLEGTLISDAMHCMPRPGLSEFLDFCKQTFERVVLYTTVNEERCRWIINELADRKEVPEWFLDVEYIPWVVAGNTKDLRNISHVEPSQCLLVDDNEIYVHPGQREQWVQIAGWRKLDENDRLKGYPEDDKELYRVKQVLAKHLRVWRLRAIIFAIIKAVKKIYANQS